MIHQRRRHQITLNRNKSVCIFLVQKDAYRATLSKPSPESTLIRLCCMSLVISPNVFCLFRRHSFVQSWIRLSIDSGVQFIPSNEHLSCTFLIREYRFWVCFVASWNESQMACLAYRVLSSVQTKPTTTFVSTAQLPHVAIPFFPRLKSRICSRVGKLQRKLSKNWRQAATATFVFTVWRVCRKS